MRLPLLLAFLATPALAEPSLPTLRLATCAALWEGYADVLGDEGERALAARFESAAVAEGGEAARALIAERRPWMRDLLVAYIHESDDQSRDLFTRLVTDCGALAADLPTP